jgi:hypothetical protein
MRLKQIEKIIKEPETIAFFDLPKISLNEWYEGTHWTKRKKIKDVYAMLVYKQAKYKFKGVFRVNYVFDFKNNPLDASNCVAMLKMIEDSLFVKDGYKNIKSIHVTSRKAKSDCVWVTIFPWKFEEV